MIIYVFWIWPVRPKKYISDDSMRRYQLKKIENMKRRNQILNKLCCYCFINENEDNYVNHLDEDENNQPQNHRNSIYHHYETDNRLIDDMSVNDDNNNILLNNNNDNDNNEYNEYNEYNDSSIEESESMRQSDIWDQHITTENITP